MGGISFFSGINAGSVSRKDGIQVLDRNGRA
jgi:hypothetical protein